MKKVIACIILAIALSGTFKADVSAKAAFKDVPESFWAYDEIQFLTGKEIIYGYQDGSFKPGKSITRLQAVQMMLREKGVKDFSNVPNPGFKDIKPGDYGYNEVAKAVELGIIHGKENAKGEKIFDPNGVLTRSQMAKILSLAYDLTGTSNQKFSDIPQSHWAYPYVQGLAKNKVTIGYLDGRFGGSDYLSRVQFAVMMARTLDDSFKDKAERPQEQTGKVYPDGWIAPVLKSTWSPNPSVNVQTLKNELGLRDGIYLDIHGKHGVFLVSQTGQFSNNEVNMKFYGWKINKVIECQ